MLEPVVQGCECIPYIRNIQPVFRGEVAMAVSPSEFYINQLGNETSNQYDLMVPDMISFYRNYSSHNYTFAAEDIYPGLLVAVPYYEVWMRGIVYKKMNNDTEWKIIILDNFDMVVKKASELRQLLARFTKLPLQAIPAKLGFIYPSNGSWSDNAKTYFRESLLDKEVMIHAVTTECESDGRFVVMLAQLSGESFDRQLIKFGHAILPGHRLKEVKEKERKVAKIQQKDDLHRPWIDILPHVPSPDNEKRLSTPPPPSPKKLNALAPVYSPVNSIADSPIKSLSFQSTNESLKHVNETEIANNNSTKENIESSESNHVSSTSSYMMDITMNSTPVKQNVNTVSSSYNNVSKMTFPNIQELSYPNHTIPALMNCNVPPQPHYNPMAVPFNFAPNQPPASIPPPGFNFNQFCPPGFGLIGGMSMQATYHQQYSYPSNMLPQNHNYWKR